MDTQSFSASSPSHHEPYKLKTSFSGESKDQTPSESQTALNHFKKGTKRDASVYPIFKNDKYYDTFQRSFLANLKAQGLYDVADPDHDPENGDTYEKELFKHKQSFVYSVLVDTILSMFRLCSCGTKPQRSQKSSFRDDVIMGTPMSS